MKAEINPLIKSSIIYIIATVIGQGMTFLGIVVFTRIMSKQDYGNYSTYYAWVSMLTVLIGANLYYALNNAYIEKKNEIKKIRKAVLVLSAIIMMTVTVLLLIVGGVIFKKYSFYEIIMAALHSYGFFVVSYRVYSANMENDYKKKQWLLILPNTLQFLFAGFFILILPGISYKARIAGSTIGVDVVAIFSIVEMLRCDGKAVHTGYWKYALSIALPTIVMSLSYMLMQQCDKVMIKNLCGAEETAVYSVIYYIGYAMIAVDQAVSPVRQAWIFRRIDKKDVSEARKIQKWYLLAMGIIAACLILTGPEIVMVLAPKNYWRFEYVVPFVLGACMMLLYRFHVEVILFYKSNAALSVSVLICAVINIALNAFLIPLLGAVAACYTTVVSYGLLFLLTWLLASRHIRGIYSWQYFIVFISGIILIAIIYSIVKNWTIVRYAILALVLLVALVYSVRQKGEWKSFLWERR